MSYEIVKSIKHDRRNNRYFVNSAVNNLIPKYYSTWEFMPNDKYEKEKCKYKDLYFFYNLIGGELQLKSCNSHKWRYALNKFFNYCYDNEININDLWNLPRHENESDITKLQPYYDIFKSFYDEKIEGKYYLYSNVGYVKRINQRSFISTYSKNDLYKLTKEYKKVYNDLCKLSDDAIKDYNIQIKEFTLDLEDNNKNNTDCQLEV